MKKITFLLIALFAISWQINSQVAIGAGSLQFENAPFDPYYGYSYTQTVYLASEISASGDITDLHWYYSGTSDLSNCQDLVIYIGETSRTEFASTTDWEPIANFTQVYAGGITVTAGVEGWTQIILDTPFTYTGSGNLIIAVDENMPNYNSSGDDFRNSQVTTNRTISYFNDDVNADPAAPPTAVNIDDTIPNIILGGITQACANPSELSASNIGSDTANLIWTENGGATLWNIELVASGNAPTGTPTASGVTNPYPASALTAETTYDYYVQADCTSETSAWVGPFTFTTLCVAFTPDYLATYDTFLQDCWNEADSGNPTTGPGDLGNSSWGVDGFANNGTTGAYNINLWQAGVKSDWLLSPLFDLTGGPFQVELDLAIMIYGSSTIAGTLGSDDQVQVLITTDNGATWIPILTWDNSTVNPVGGDHFVFDLTAYSGMTVQFGIWATDGSVGDSADTDVSVDNFQVRNIPSCVEPSGLSVANLTPSGADLIWTENGDATLWNIEIVASGDAPTGTPTASGVTNPYPATGLSAISSYDFYVQADCGVTGLSSWTGPFTFTTLCDVFVPDYLATFDTFLQDCWDEADSGNPTIGPGNIGNSSWLVDGFANVGSTGAYNINLWQAAKSDWLLSPQFDLTGGPFQVELDLAIMNYASSTVAGTLGSDDQVQVLMTTDGGTTWTAIMTWDNTTVNPVGGDHFVFDLTAYSGMTVQFGIWASEGSVDDTTDTDVSVDNFQVRNIPTCLEPSAIFVANITSSSADLSWTANGGETSWNIEIVASGDAPTGTPTASGVTNPYPATGLSAISSYDFYVQADCGVTGLSSWTGPFTFTTLCDVFIPDYLATFDTFLQDCWDEADSGNPTIGPGNIGNSSWLVDGFANVGSTGAYNINLWQAAKSDWLLSPQFDLTGGPFQVELDLAIMNYASSTVAGTLGSDDQVQVLMTTDGGTTWTAIMTWDNTTVNPVGGEHFVFDLTAYSGMTVQFGIWASEGSVNDSADTDVSVDNFEVRNIPICSEPSGLTATNLSLTSTELGWVENGTSTLWNIEYGEAGFTPGAGTLINDITTNPYVLSALTSDTLYEFYVQSNCDTDGLSSWTGPYSFYTGYCVSEPSSNDGQGVTNVSIGITDFPSFGDFTYENHTATPVNAFQGIQTDMSITFATGYSYYTNIWIDFNDDMVFDATELVFQGESTNANPTTLDATFTMPLTATLGEHRMRVGTADSGQATPNPCYNGSWGVTLDFTVNILMLNCTLAEAEYATVLDCDNDQFFIDVNVTSLGDATSLEISNDFDANTTQATATGVYQIGPFAFGSSVKVIITNEQDNDCVISSNTFTLLACPPDNDNPCSATVAVVNDNESCDLLTSGTILEATDSGVANGACIGDPDDDVWFEFTALTEVQLISIVNIAGGSVNLDHGVYEGTCDGLIELYCSDDAASITPELVVGNTYFIRVFSAGSVGETSTFDLCIKEAPDNTVCENASPFCGEGGALYGSNVIGIPNDADVACLGSIPNPSWNILQIGETGPINIQITQNTAFDAAGNPIGQGLDVDFVLWGPFDNTIDYCELNLLVDCPTCPNNTANPDFYPYNEIVDCSYDPAFIETVTIDNAIEGEIYVLLVTNYSDDPGTIQIQQTNAGETGAGGVTSEIEVDLGADQDFCGFPSYELNADSPFADRYEWYADGFIIDGETSSTLTVTESDTYTVIAYDDNCDAQAQDSIVVIFGMEPVANPVDDMVTCDDASGDEVEDFDLESQTATILGTQDPTVFNITYHLTLVDAQTNTGALSSPYNNTSNPQTIYVRVEDANATFCFVTSSFDLIISGPTPTATSVDIEVCDDDADGIADFDLAAHDANVLSGQDETIFTVTYYETEANAEAGTSAIDTATFYTSTSQTIYARVESNIAFDCYSVVDFDLVVNELPNTTFTTDFEYEVCPNATVPVIITATANNYNTADVSISWYRDGGVISGESGLTLPVLLAGSYSIVVTNTNSGCSTSTDIEIIELEQCIIPQGISPNGDQWNETFDLSSFDVSKLEIFNRNGTLVYSKKNYSNEWHGQSNKGEQLPIGTYFFTMEYQNGKRKSAWVYINE